VVSLRPSCPATVVVCHWRDSAELRRCVCVVDPLNKQQQLIHSITTVNRVSQEDTGFPYSLLSVGHRADPAVQAMSPEVTISYPPGTIKIKVTINLKTRKKRSTL